MSTFQQRLRQAMFFKGIRQVDIANRTGIKDSKISSYVSGRYKPNAVTMLKIADALGVSATWLAGEGPDLTEAEVAGMVKEATLHVEDPLGAQSIPIVGSVAAGTPIFAWENQIGTVVVKDLRQGLFALHVRGDSMAPRIVDGDLVIVHKQDHAEDGDIVIALVEDEATCKVLKKSAWGVSLVPFNSSYAPFIYAGEETSQLHIVGKVIGSYHSWE